MTTQPCQRCGRSDGTHIGYHEDAELPIKIGDQVYLKAGAKIRTTHPTQKNLVNKRRRLVKVFSMDCGQTVNTSLYGDAEHERRILKLEWLVQKEDDAARRAQMRLELADLQRGLLHTQDPGICWVGTGGYWHYADLTDVESMP